MKRPIITDINFLKQLSRPIIYVDEAKQIIKDLEDTLDLNKGIGLSAIQIGIPKNVAIIRYDNIKIDLINTHIRYKEDKFRFKGEGCLSLPGLHIDTIRYKNIYIVNKGKDEDYTGILAIAIEHEVDHMSGITILDRKWKGR